MPLYEYCCRRCGPFKEWRAISQATAPVPCPSCGKSGRRMVSAPNLGIPSALRQAHARNEKSAHEPKVERRQVHGHAHGHEPHAPTRRARRPWAIGH